MGVGRRRLYTPRAPAERAQLVPPLPSPLASPLTLQLGSSSGAEDYFMSGFDWRGGPCFAHELAGAGGTQAVVRGGEGQLQQQQMW